MVVNNGSQGLITAASQQRSFLIQSRDLIYEPSKAFKRDMHKILTQCTRHGHEILLVGDFNENLDTTNSRMAKLAADFHLVDLMSLLSSRPPPSTYARGHSRLDYGLVTRQVAEVLVAGGYESFGERHPTDHGAYFFDLDTTALFGSDTQSLASPTLRMLHSNNVVQVTAYIQEKYEQQRRCNAFARGDKLSDVGSTHNFAEQLDKDVVASSLSAEKRTHKYHLPAWSVELSSARAKIVVLKNIGLCSETTSQSATK